MEQKSIKQTLFAMLDDLPSGRYGLWTITDALNDVTKLRTMPHTVKSYCKEYADAAGAEFRCVVNAKSIYEYTSGYKIAGALEGKE